MNRVRKPARRRGSTALFAVLGGIFWSVCLVAQVGGEMLPGIDDQDTRGGVVMAARDCLAIALESNLDISISKYDPLISEAELMQARGEFDPLWSVDWLEREEKSPTSAQYKIFGVPVDSLWERRTTVDTSFDGKVPTGTTYSLNLGSIRTESTFTEFSGAGSEYRGSGELILSQPLLNGFGLGVNLARIRIAKNNKDISEEQLSLTVMDTAAQVLRAYWDLVFAKEILVVARQSLRNARDLLEQNRLRVEVGTAAPIQVRQAEAGVKRREAEVISAIAAIRDAEDRLKLLLDVHRDAALWAQAIMPADKPLMIMRSLDEQLSYAAALERRPELVQAEKTLENAETVVRVSKNALLPTVDLQGSYGFNSLRGGFNDEVEYLVRGDDWKFFYGVVGRIPIGNRMAKGDHVRSRYERDRAELAIRKLEQAIRLEIRTAIRQVETNRQLVETNATATKLQEQTLEDEKKRYEVGVSTSYRVLEFEEDLARARSDELRALVDYRKALISLDRAEGTILERYNIELVSSQERS
jgi:outer membrane protein TolC